MTLPLNREVLQGAYDYLRATEPFCRWNLPDGEDISFKVIRSLVDRGQYYRVDGKHTISISSSCIGRSSSLMEIMAHEMIHLHEREARFDRADVEHTRAFKKLALRVCAIHGFDSKLFW